MKIGCSGVCNDSGAFLFMGRRKKVKQTTGGSVVIGKRGGG